MGMEDGSSLGHCDPRPVVNDCGLLWLLVFGFGFKSQKARFGVEGEEDVAYRNAYGLCV
jgi:hypothetical protein